MAFAISKKYQAHHSYILQTTENSVTYQPSTIDSDAAEANCSKNNRSEFHCCLFVKCKLDEMSFDVWLCQDSRRQQPAFAAARSIDRTHHVYSNTTTATHHIILRLLCLEYPMSVQKEYLRARLIRPIKEAFSKL